MQELTPALSADFLEWLKTGSFRGVRPGMTRGECIEKLGEPEAWGPMGRRKSESRAGIYLWSQVEFHFNSSKHPADSAQDQLLMIFSDWEKTISALFGYGYDYEREIPLTELLDLLRPLDPNFKKYLIKDNYYDERATKIVWRDDFQFYAAGEPGAEILKCLEQNPFTQVRQTLEEIP